MMEATKAQLPKYIVDVMVAIGMRPMTLNVIGKNVYLRVKGPSGLSRDLRTKRCPNT